MNWKEVQAIVDDVSIDQPSVYIALGGTNVQHPEWLQMRNSALPMSFATGRKWRLSQYMTKSEIVQTALSAWLTWIEHEGREQFKYKGVAIFGPHFDVEALVEIADCVEVRL